MLDLRSATQSDWLDKVLSDFDGFLADHANCEKKASATGLAFISRYPDRVEFIPEWLAFAREELEHFERVFLVLLTRGKTLPRDEKDDYVRSLRALARNSGEAGLVDALLIAGIIEARGCERLKMVADALPQHHELKGMYLDLTRAEARHHALFFRMAKDVIGSQGASQRADYLLEQEARIVSTLPLEARVH